MLLDLDFKKSNPWQLWIIFHLKYVKNKNKLVW